MAHKPAHDLISIDRVRHLFAYDAETGALTWRNRPSHHTKKSIVGTLAGNIIHNGHRVVIIGGETYQASRLAWAHHYGAWPAYRLKFDDGDPANLRVSNMRETGLPGDYDASTPEGKAAYSRAHREAYRPVYRDKHLQRTFGITLADYDAMLADQGGKCAICRGDQTATRWGNGTPFHVDHCHDTGKVRGLLCAECNTGLGKFKDSVVTLIRAAEYVRRHQAPTNIIPFPSGKDTAAPADMARAS